MSADPLVLAAIAAMAAATYFTRLAGLWIASRFALRGRARAAVEAIPGSVLIAVITPLVAGAGPAALAAGAVTALAAWRFPMVAVVIVGVASAAAFRQLL